MKRFKFVFVMLMLAAVIAFSGSVFAEEDKPKPTGGGDIILFDLVNTAVYGVAGDSVALDLIGNAVDSDTHAAAKPTGTGSTYTVWRGSDP